MTDQEFAMLIFAFLMAAFGFGLAIYAHVRIDAAEKRENK